MSQQRHHFHQFLVSPLIGGGSQVALQIAVSVKERGEASVIWIPGQGPMQKVAQKAGLATQEFHSDGAFSRWRVRAAVSNWRVGRRLRTFGRGIAHVHSPYVFRALRVGLRLASVKTIVHVHAFEDAEGLRWAMQDPPSLIVTCARFLEDHVRQCLPDRFKGSQAIVSVPNAVDTQRFRVADKRKTKAELGAPLDRPLLLVLANLSQNKGQEVAIRTTAILKQRGIDVVCWLAGEERSEGTTYSRRLETLIQEADVGDRVHLLGQRSDAPALLQAADYLLLPSSTEGLPLTILEAHASKLPVLSTAVGGIPEIIEDGKTGFLISQSDAEAFASQITKLIESPEMRTRVTEAAYAQVLRDHRLDSYSSRIIEIYQQLQECNGPTYRRQYSSTTHSHSASRF
jgi:glycosyltransferase involved in cell wall biosynthesis